MLFYPRSPCGERLVADNRLVAEYAFSIHALLAESDRNKHKGQALNDIFLSTLSLRRATEESGYTYTAN